MKVLTLTQPWATLVAIGAQRIVPRSWATKYRGPLLIHAAAGLGPGGMRAHTKLCGTEPFYSILNAAWKTHYDALDKSIGLLRAMVERPFMPTGAIIARCELRDVRIIGREQNGDATILADDMLSFTPILGNELAFGDYSPGRYAWLLADVQPLATPIPAKGALGLWNWEGSLP